MERIEWNDIRGQETSVDALVTDRAGKDPSPDWGTTGPGGLESQGKSAGHFFRTPHNYQTLQGRLCKYPSVQVPFCASTPVQVPLCKYPSRHLI